MIYFFDEKRKKGRPFVGKLLRRFSPDENSGIQYLETERLKYTLGALTVLEKNPSHFDRETDIIPAWDVVAGPLKVTLEVKTSTTSIRKLTSSKFLVPGYPKFIKSVSMVSKIDRETEYKHLFLN